MNTITVGERRVAKVQLQLNKAEVKADRDIKRIEARRDKAITTLQETTQREIDLIQKGVTALEDVLETAKDELRKLSGGAPSKDPKKSGTTSANVPFDRPTPVEAVQLVLGKKTMKMVDIVREVIARGWARPNSNPKQSIPVAVGKRTKSTPPIFENVGRGLYCVHPSAPPLSREARAHFGNVKTPVGTSPVGASLEATPSTKGKKEPRACSVCGQAGHNKRGHDKAMAKHSNSGEAPKRTSEDSGAKKGRGCSICGQAGHNKTTHDKVVAKQTNGASQETHAPRKAVVSAPSKAASTSPEKAHRTCSVCGQSGHNKKGHDKAVAAQNNPESVFVSTGQTKCSVCGQSGHNKRGHDKATGIITMPVDVGDAPTVSYATMNADTALQIVSSEKTVDEVVDDRVMDDGKAAFGTQEAM